ncbi:hypothetical protein LTS18_003764 [Coniosporium uncinatum]|uniref:Uncharacterized protein n=1 Tax=Coniosporium uncinatum TaxID=93489 RepID=A0ACC3DXW4_9PEZI|nr:hypothetical protein LTS18_003764 [Coniosporium uncinatum]
MSEATAVELFEHLAKPPAERLRWNDAQIVGFVIEVLADNVCSPKWLRVVGQEETEKCEAHRERNAIEYEHGPDRRWKSLHVELDSGGDRKAWDFEQM